MKARPELRRAPSGSAPRHQAGRGAADAGERLGDSRSMARGLREARGPARWRLRVRAVGGTPRWDPRPAPAATMVFGNRPASACSLPRRRRLRANTPGRPGGGRGATRRQACNRRKRRKNISGKQPPPFHRRRSDVEGARCGARARSYLDHGWDHVGRGDAKLDMERACSTSETSKGLDFQSRRSVRRRRPRSKPRSSRLANMGPAPRPGARQVVREGVAGPRWPRVSRCGPLMLSNTVAVGTVPCGVGHDVPPTGTPASRPPSNARRAPSRRREEGPSLKLRRGPDALGPDPIRAASLSKSCRWPPTNRGADATNTVAEPH